MQNLKVISNNKSHRRRLGIRRFVTITFISMVFVVSGYLIYSVRIRNLNTALAQLEYYEEKYSEMILRQDFYSNEIVRLGDEDYIAMLARQRYFRSLPNEILFRISDEESGLDPDESVDDEE